MIFNWKIKLKFNNINKSWSRIKNNMLGNKIIRQNLKCQIHNKCYLDIHNGKIAVVI